ncbi:hypothetical protein NCU07323 [Neurospora crassa OR74A]|uniref:Uncharacterized protein n=1 Tax=Neurospora crassa (strain ATCC 24698 / 74-OR23-1A / CBS 708.71 / DSM 1257 / FGSC 987) TaxID=367110 RepID=V5IMT1_NEUCR|nr:hypothetical protein NCU07323 [Neurospora crassa OR74A]ESA43002.1 hypothetical protein NCU07323 [Neurospora crassa OR74A]|eukprot:XP_011394243.1 hypothetical protein NCU07323 [Neurospora crassa OR74A]
MVCSAYQPRWPHYMQYWASLTQSPLKRGQASISPSQMQRLSAEPLVYEPRASYLPMLRQKAPLKTVLGSSKNNRYKNLATVAAYQVCISGTLSI